MSFSIGPPPGWREEDRPLQKVRTHSGWDFVQIAVVCRGEHLIECRAVDEGWICADTCPVEDMRMLIDYETTTDELVRVFERYERQTRSILGVRVPRWIVRWSVTRVGIKQRYRNGRRRASASGDRTYTCMYAGKTRTKWGARRRATAAIQSDRVQVIP